ncbi:hypothetical protein SAMN04487959_103140 [Modicisalibacter xianhensis]|uniref:Uncharacterized protein n=1 Tax=Modicisalibacter xianhensis TaxID=442341 RepID=A0A1I2ZI56_9GAMM|nr:hypothetical protein SAMN04487959_103140 [Halomonas xianhensis]
MAIIRYMSLNVYPSGYDEFTLVENAKDSDAPPDHCTRMVSLR